MHNDFCYNCMKKVKPMIIENNEEFEVRGKLYKYRSIRLVCSICGEELDVLDEDIYRRQEAYRKSEGLILNSEIEKLLTKYKIGKKPLARLLGWSEVTIIRYLNGETPSKMYSDELYKLLESPDYMEEVLEKNKDNISVRAYENVKRALDMKDKDSEINLIANYIISKVDITPLALQKLLYYCNGFYYAMNFEGMFKDKCEAWKHGPVYPQIYKKYKNYTYNTLFEKSKFFVDEIIDDDKKIIIDAVLESFGLYSAKCLELMTHEEDPWVNARKGVEDDENSKNVIKETDIDDYFTSLLMKYDIESPEDIKKYSTAMYKKIISGKIKR